MRPGIKPSAPLVYLALAGCSLAPNGDGYIRETGARHGNLEHHSVEEQVQALGLRAGDVLILEVSFGDIKVRPVGDGEAELRCLFSADGSKAEAAQAALNEAEVALVREGRQVRVRIPKPSPRSAARRSSTLRSDVEVTAPEGVEIRVKTSHGEIDIRGPLGAIRAETSFGDVRVTNTGNGVVARSSSGDLELRGIRGEEVRAKTSFGDVTLEDIDVERVIVESSNGDLTLRETTAGKIEADSSFGDITLRQVSGDVTAETSSGTIRLTDAAEGSHWLHSGFGEVKVRRAEGVVVASSNNGDIEIEEFKGEVKATSSFGSVQLMGTFSRVLAESESGDVEVGVEAGSQPTADWRIASGFGDIEISLPEGVSCVVEASTAFGEVDATIDSGVSSRSSAGGETLELILGDGGHRIEVRAKSGDIEVHRTK